LPSIFTNLFDNASLIATALLAADWLLRIGLSVRVVMRRSSVGVTLSWLMVVLAFPIAGVVIYLILGENRLGTRRANATVKLHNAYAGWRSGLRDRSRIDWQRIAPGCDAIHRQALGVSGVPALPGNTLDLFSDSHEALTAIVRDLDAAKLHCHLEFYIWQDGGAVDEVAEALIRAAQRGVTCRVLLDAVGSKNFLRRSPQRRAMADAGVEVVESLPAGLFRALFRRLDLRNHRKLVVVDGCVGYTGSLNMIDPGLFKHDAGVGAWIDAMVRVQGPAVEALAVVFSKIGSSKPTKTSANTLKPALATQRKQPPLNLRPPPGIPSSPTPQRSRSCLRGRASTPSPSTACSLRPSTPPATKSPSPRLISSPMKRC